MRRLATVTAGCWLLACTGDSPHDDTHDSAALVCPANEDESAVIAPECCTGELALVLGNGDEPFEERLEGSCHTMVHGPQGGWHMEVSARVCGTYDRVYLHYQIYDLATNTRISDNTYKVKLDAEPDGCCGTFDGMYGYLDMSGLRTADADSPPELLCLNELELRLEVWDLAGQVVGTTRRVIGAPHQDDLAICDPGECPVDTDDLTDTGEAPAQEAR